MMGFLKSKQERFEDESQEIVEALREGRQPPPSKGLSRRAEKVLENDPSYYYCGACKCMMPISHFPH